MRKLKIQKPTGLFKWFFWFFSFKKNGELCWFFIFSILTRTTQPAHIAVIFAALFIAVSVNANQKKKSDDLVYKFIYAAATATHFGSQIWMTFASGN